MVLFYNKRNIFIGIVIAALIICSVIFVAFPYAKKGHAKQNIPVGAPMFISEDGKIDAENENDKDKIYVHVTGAVKNPDVYKLMADKRVIDAITAAGGATEEGYVDAHNLAAFLEDGMKIYVPTKSEWEKDKEKGMPELVETSASSKYIESEHSTSSKSGTANANSDTDYYTNSGPKPLPTEKISINNGSLEDLMLLPGIGETIANNIIQYRKANGKFETLEDLMKVAKIGEKTYEKLAPYIKL